MQLQLFLQKQNDNIQLVFCRHSQIILFPILPFHFCRPRADNNFNFKVESFTFKQNMCIHSKENYEYYEKQYLMEENEKKM